MKTCPKCGREKDASEFHRSKDTKDGLQSLCKLCSKAANAAWHATNPERAKARSAAYHSANPEHVTAGHHYVCAHNPLSARHQNYKNMIFHPAWDTARGTPKAAATFARNASAWMRTNGCARPGSGYALHVDKTNPLYPHGYFGPDGIRWVPKRDVHEKREIAKMFAYAEHYGYTVAPNLTTSVFLERFGND